MIIIIPKLYISDYMELYLLAFILHVLVSQFLPVETVSGVKASHVHVLVITCLQELSLLAKLQGTQRLKRSLVFQLLLLQLKVEHGSVLCDFMSLSRTR